MGKFDNISVIAFDADDTLWDCQSHFADAERRYCGILEPYADATTVSDVLFAVESANMPLLGYGGKAFTISLVENALKLSGYRISAADVARIIDLGKSLLRLPATPLPGVRDALEALRGYRLVLFTKGELHDQRGKLMRSGLSQYFSHVEIVADKSKAACLSLCRTLRVEPHRLLMVGNSFKSDIMPMLSIGASAVYVPFHVTWKYEHADEFSHDRLERITSISQLPGLL